MVNSYFEKNRLISCNLAIIFKLNKSNYFFQNYYVNIIYMHSGGWGLIEKIVHIIILINHNLPNTNIDMK